MSITVLSYPRCGTCRKALKWLDAHEVVYEVRPIVDENPTADELRSWIAASGLPIKGFFNTSGKAYRELNMKDRFKEGITDEECIALLAADGMLVKRPIVLGQDFVLVGFKEADWEAKLLA